VIAFVKNEGNNLNTMAIALHSIIIYQPNLWKYVFWACDV
jgi:hypothetical protein